MPSYKNRVAAGCIVSQRIPCTGAQGHRMRGGALMSVLIGLFVIGLLMLQLRLWQGEGSVAEVVSLTDKVKHQQVVNEALQKENKRIAIRAAALKEGLDEIESRAREDLGLVKPEETFFLMVDEP